MDCNHLRVKVQRCCYLELRGQGDSFCRMQSLYCRQAPGTADCGLMSSLGSPAASDSAPPLNQASEGTGLSLQV